MSRNRRRFAPHGRKFNERGIERRDDNFLGLSTDHIRTPKNHLEELDNARAFGTEIRGNRGTLLHNRADYNVTPSGSTYVGALDPGGAIYEGKGSAPAEGDVFITTNYDDFIDSSLRESKRDALNTKISPDADYPYPLIHGFYRVRLNEIQPDYIGNLQVPYYKNYAPRDVNGAFESSTFTKVGNTITRNFILTTPPFTQAVVGMYFTYGTLLSNNTLIEKRDVITSFVDSNTVTVSKSDLVLDDVYSRCTIQPKIHSSLYMTSVKRMYAHVGEDIYEVGIPIMSWTKLCNISGLKPFTSDSTMNEVKGDVILSSDNGHFKIKVGKGNEPSHYWKINTDRPSKAINNTVYFFGFSTSQASSGENPYAPLGFSGTTDNVTADKTGGMLLS